MSIFEEYPYVIILDVIGAFCAFGLPFYVLAYVISLLFKVRKKVFVCLSLLFSLAFYGCAIESVYHEFPHLRGWEWDRIAEDLPHLISGVLTLLCSPFILSRFLKDKPVENKSKQ